MGKRRGKENNLDAADDRKIAFHLTVKGSDNGTDKSEADTLSSKVNITFLEEINETFRRLEWRLQTDKLKRW